MGQNDWEALDGRCLFWTAFRWKGQQQRRACLLSQRGLWICAVKMRGIKVFGVDNQLSLGGWLGVFGYNWQLSTVNIPDFTWTMVKLWFYPKTWKRICHQSMLKPCTVLRIAFSFMFPTHHSSWRHLTYKSINTIGALQSTAITLAQCLQTCVTDERTKPR